jgi:hypothetical protein
VTSKHEDWSPLFAVWIAIVRWIFRDNGKRFQDNESSCYDVAPRDGAECRLLISFSSADDSVQLWDNLVRLVFGALFNLPIHEFPFLSLTTSFFQRYYFCYSNFCYKRIIIKSNSSSWTRRDYVNAFRPTWRHGNSDVTQMSRRNQLEFVKDIFYVSFLAKIIPWKKDVT